MRRLFLLMLLAALPVYSQNSGTQVFVVATKTAFIWGEQVKVTATVRDSQGVAQNVPVTWSVIPSTAAKVAADGTVTPLEFTNFVIQAQANGVTAEVAMQVIPKKIVVTPAAAAMTVGGTQKVRADALDINDAPVPSARLNWFLFNLMGGWDNNFPMASIDNAGNLHALVAGRLKVVGQIQYDYNPYSIVSVAGEGVVDINPPQTYRVTRVFSGAATRNTSALAPTSSPLIPTQNGFAFIASLDLASSALVEWTPNGIHPIAVSGRAGANRGQPLIQFNNLTSSHGSQFLFAEGDTQGAGQISAGSTGYTQPLLVTNSPLFGAENTSFQMSRNSLAAGGMKILQANYTDLVTRRFVTALYRGYDRGLSESIVNTLDGVPGFEGQPFTIVTYGIADDGTAWFVLNIGPAGQTRNVLFRARPGSPIEKILARGESFQNEQVQSIVPAEDPPSFFASNNGDILMDIITDRGKILVRWNASDGWATPDLLRSTSNGIFWHEPAVGTLISGPNSGLYLWSKSGATPLLQLGDSSIDGSPVQQIFSATANEQGAVYAKIRTNANPMLIARLSPDRSVILKAGDSLPFGAPPVISTMLTRSGSGNPFVIAGGSIGSIARLQDDGGLLPIVRIGDPLPNGKPFGGVQISTFYKQASVLSDGRVVFGSNSNEFNDGIFVWHDGAIDWPIRFPLQFGNSLLFGTPNAFSINSRGDWVAQMSGTGIYLVRGSNVQKVMTAGETPPGLAMTGFSYPVIDESGHISFELFSGGDNYILQWDGTVSNIILRPGHVMPDGRSVRTVGANLLVAGTTLVTSIGLSDGQWTAAAYNNGTWQYLIGKTDRTASGDYVNFGYSIDVNNRGDLAFAYFGNNYNVEIAARVNNTFHYIQSMSDFLPDGALLLGITQILMNDDGTVFILGVDDLNQQVIYKAAPEDAGTPYSIADRGGVSMTATQQTAKLNVGFGIVQPANNGVTPAGLAIFQFRQNGVLVTEAAVPATQPVQSGRIYAETNGTVNTGVAIANPNPHPAEISFYFTDENGKDFGPGTMFLSAGAQTAAFLDQSPFNGGTSFKGTFTFTSNLPVGAIALRGLLNERSEFLITTLPVSPLSAAAGAQVLPYFADGGGWTTQILLINPSDSPTTGTVQFFDSGSPNTAGAATTVSVNGQAGTSFPYSIPARSSRRIGTSGGGSNIKTGSVRVVPSGASAPSVANVFSYKPGSVTVSEAGITVVPPGRAFRMYVEASGNFAQAEPGSMQSGIAFANPSTTAVALRVDVMDLSGSAIGSTDVLIPANGQVAMFLNQVPGLGTLPQTFQGVVRVSSSSTAFSLVGLRARFNERGDFLITTTRPFDESDPAPATPSLFPHLAVGGGYSTQFILMNIPPAAAKAGVIRFLSSSGDSLPLVLR